MPYTPQTWADTAAGGTPLSAARLAVMETGIANASPTAFATLTSGATVTWATAGKLLCNAELALAHNATLDITGAVAGASGWLVVTQDPTTAYTLALPAGTVFGQAAIDPTLGAKSAVAWSYNGAAFTFVIGYEA
jgi:hypothetical protein